MYRYKTLIGRRLHARTLPNQQTEAKRAPCGIHDQRPKVAVFYLARGETIAPLR